MGINGADLYINVLTMSNDIIQKPCNIFGR